jgi:hypothetical protein
VNTGYKIKAEWFTFDVEFGDFAKLKRGGPNIDSGSSGKGATGGLDPSALRGVQGPSADRTFTLPGSDGEVVEMELPLVAAGNLVAQPRGGGLSPIAIALASVGVVVLGLGGVTVIRRRRLSRSRA